MELEDEADAAAAEGCKFAAAEREDVRSVDEYSSAVGGGEGASIWRRVVLPAPDAPVIATTSPSPAAKSTPRRTLSAPKDLQMPLALMILFPVIRTK